MIIILSEKRDPAKQKQKVSTKYKIIQCFLDKVRHFKSGVR